LVWSRLCYFCRRGLSHCGGVGPIGECVRLISPLFLWSAWAQPLSLRFDSQGRWSGLPSVYCVGVGSVTVVAGREKRAFVCSRLCSFGRHGLSHCGGGPIDKGVGLVSPLFLWSAWAGKLWRRADRQLRWSGLACSFVRLGLSQCGMSSYHEAAYL
jgi:hypothetical protein